MAEGNSSPWRKSLVFIDQGELLVGRDLLFYGDYEPIVYTTEVPAQIHVCVQNQTLEQISTIYYHDPRLYWVIADFQPEEEIPIFGPHEPLKAGTRILIPDPLFVRGILAS